MTVVPPGSYLYADLPGRRSGDPLAGAATASSLRIVELVPAPGRRPHRHPHSEEVVYVRAGRGVVWIDGEVSEVGPGSVVVVPRGAAHATIPAEPMELVCFFPHPDLAANIEELDTAIDLEGT